MSPDDSTPEKADQYEYPDGTVEVVFAVEEGRVLTIREYPDAERFARSTDAATYVGTHAGVGDLPGPEAFREDP